MTFLSTLSAVVRATAALDLSNWMGETLDAIGGLTPLDLVLAGTHDTLTYDLDKYIAESEPNNYEYCRTK